MVLARVGGDDEQVRRGTVLEPGDAEEAARRPGRRLEDLGGGEPGGVELVELVVDDAVAEHSPGIGADQQLHPGVVGIAGAVVAAGAQAAHVRGVGGELLLALGGVGLELVDIHQGGHHRDARLGDTADRLVGQARGVLEAVEARVEDEREGLLVEGVGGDAGTRGVGGVGRGDEVLRLPARCQIADAAVDPVADELDPAVTAAGLTGDGGGQVLGLELVGIADQVAAGAGKVAAAADQPRQVALLLQRGVVDDRAGVADQQHPGVAVDEGLLARLGEGGAPSPVGDAEVAVQVGEAGEHEAVDLANLGAGGQLGLLVVDPAADDPGAALLLLGAEQDRSAQVEDRCGGLGDIGGAHAAEPIDPGPGPRRPTGFGLEQQGTARAAGLGQSDKRRRRRRSSAPCR